MTTRLPGGSRRFNRNEDGSGTSTSNSGKRAPNPPSRHLWVGNLAEGVHEEEVSFEFSRFGELDSVAFQPGRSYAFINFVEHDDAIAALTYLQGRSLAGNPLRIEFAKLDKPSAASNDRDYIKHQDQLRAASRGSPFSQRVRDTAGEQFYSEKSNAGDRGGEPSEVLWIGFPALLKVDELILRKAFSPFGEIEKITAFPGRSYAFVRFRSINSAYKAKETLQGKLFGNPRVHICFAKSENGASSSQFKSKSRSESYWQDSNPKLRSHPYPDSDCEDSSVYGVERVNTFLSDDQDSFSKWRSREVYRDHVSPNEESGTRFRRISPNFSNKEAIYEEQWHLPNDSYYIQGAKRLRASTSNPPDSQLPDFLFDDSSKERYQYPRAIPDSKGPVALDKNADYANAGHSSLSYRSGDMQLPHGSVDEKWKTSNELHLVPGTLLNDDKKRFTPEPEHSSLRLWKWEGTIAKGGSPVCRAHCFPVGKSMNFMLPEFLDCTARTGLDMLAKHYYQASSAWVVFFVPDDADIEYYNEFMHYLEEKQRAAVAKLDERTTLFLVPPSDFSEKVLKVPGKLSISGVALRVENSVHPMQGRESDTPHMQRESSYEFRQPIIGKAMSPSDVMHIQGEASYESRPPLMGSAMSPPAFSGVKAAVGRVSDDSYNEDMQEFPRHGLNGGHGFPDHTNRAAYAEPKRPLRLNENTDSALLENKKSWVASNSVHMKNYGQKHSYDAAEIDSQRMQVGHLRALPREKAQSVHANPPGAGGESTDPDAQKCLQATLQLAAALLHQIQQGKGGS